MARLYSRQLYFGYIDPGFTAVSPGPSAEVWMVRDVLVQFQGTPGHIDLALMDVDGNWASLMYETVGVDDLDRQMWGRHIVWEEGLALVAVVTDITVAVFISGYKLTIP